MIGILEVTATTPTANGDFAVFADSTPDLKPISWLKDQATSGTPIWAVCCNCDHSRLVDPSDLLVVIRQDVKLVSELSDRMRCRACGSKACNLREGTPIPEYAV